MHDAISAEQAGVPAAAIITDRFRQTAEAVSGLYGMQGYAFVVVPHPISSDSPSGLQIKAKGAVQHAVAILTERE
jgi:hypothetical protein